MNSPAAASVDARHVNVHAQRENCRSGIPTHRGGGLTSDVHKLGRVGRIAAANHEIVRQGDPSLQVACREARVRGQRALLENLIAALEARNLNGNRCIDRRVRGWVRRVGAEFGIPVPRKVLRARNTARLHSALLDWMEAAHDDLLPEVRVKRATQRT